MSSWRDKLAVVAQRNRLEIVKAKLSRREMMRLGLVTAGGALVAKQGLSARAFAKGGADDLQLGTAVSVPPSPMTRQWVQPMPRIPVKIPVLPQNMLWGAPDGTTPIDGATQRINHQLCTYDENTHTYGGKFPPKKFYELTVKEAGQKFHPDYAPTTIWGFDGQFPGPNFHANYGEPIMVRFHNHMPSVKKPQNFGIAEMSTHLHNGHTPSESDGNPVNYFNSINDPNSVNPHGFKDQHYPNVLAGYTARGDLVGDPTEALSSLWYHDHHLDFTAQNVYKGMAGVYNLFDDKDTGDETTGLRLPSGAYDIPIMFSDPLFDPDCQLVFDLFNLDGILGDKVAANGALQPTLDVDKRRYRFRLYAPGPSRWWEFALYDGKNFLPFWQISTDGNLLPQAIPVNSVRVAVAERADIIVDFSKITASRIYLVNRLDQVNGRGPTGKILTPGTPIIQINIGKAAPDYSRDPSLDYTDPAHPKPGPFKMRTLPDVDFNALVARAKKAKTRTFRFERGNGAWMVNGQFFDENVVSANPAQESEEVWVIQNPGGSWRHPVHIHFEEHRVLSRNGVAPTPNKQSANACVDFGRKDVIQLNDSEEVHIFMRFRDMKGRYPMHCHNVVHEDHAMMVRWDIV